MATTGKPEKVKVTINLPKDLVKTAKLTAIEREVDLQDLIDEGLRLVLKRRGGKP